MSYIGKNIRKIRTVKKLSQSDFATIFSLARPSVGAYEEERAEPKIDTVIQIAQYFGLSIDTLLTKELTINDLYKFDIFKKLKPEITPIIDRDATKEDTPLVFISNELEYIVNYKNKDFINKLPFIQLPTLKEEKTRAFEVNGNEMEYNNNGLHPGDFVLCIPIDVTNVHSLEIGKVYVAVTPKKILTRRLLNKTNYLEFIPDNPSFKIEKVLIEEILELWEAIGVYSTYLKPPMMIEERVHSLESKLNQLYKKFEEIEERIK